MAAIFVYIGVNLEPGLVSSPFIQRWVKQTANIGGRLRCSRRGIAHKWEARNDYQAVSLGDNGIVSSAMKDEIAVKNNVNTTVATITTPTYSSGVAGLNGVKRKDSPFRWRHLKQTVNIGGSLKWLSRHTALVIGKVLTTTKRHLSEMMVWPALQRISKLQLTQRNHDSQLRLTYRVTGIVNDGETGNPKPKLAWQSRAKPRNELGICVETKCRPLSGRGEEIVQSLLKGKTNCFAAMIIFGVDSSSAFIQRWVKQTLNIGENLRWQLRGIALEIGKALETTKGRLSETVV